MQAGKLDQGNPAPLRRIGMSAQLYDVILLHVNACICTQVNRPMERALIYRMLNLRKADGAREKPIFTLASALA